MFDVVVIGSGLAGITAAVNAAEQGARVALVSAGAIFSGSSFFEGTWGLGLVGPDGVSDEQSLIASILDVGRGMAVPDLAKTLVHNIDPAIERLESRGCVLRSATKTDEQEYIPCFDSKQRAWHGLERTPFKTVMQKALERESITLLPHHDLIALEGNEGLAGAWRAVVFDQKRSMFVQLNARAVVLATGGFGGLFERTLTRPDVCSTAQAVALECGAELINAEFIQIMPGLTKPVTNVVFNEKTFRYAHIDGLDQSINNIDELLAMRAGHGPFNASSPDRAIDIALAHCGTEGAALHYNLPAQLPEFIETYKDWFEKTYQKDPMEGIALAAYAHASNGGILIGADAQTSVPGLFACGECTGGMHGANRIGGLSSANALVFGEIAGTEAARYAAALGGADAPDITSENLQIPRRAAKNAGEILHTLKHVMSTYCMVERTEAGLKSAQEMVEAYLDTYYEAENLAESTTLDPHLVVQSIKTHQALISAQTFICAALARKESRGAHYRADYPEERADYAQPLVVTLENGVPKTAPLS